MLHCTAAVQSAIFLSAKYTRALLKCHVDSEAEFGQYKIVLCEKFVMPYHQLSLRFSSSFRGRSVLVSLLLLLLLWLFSTGDYDIIVIL